MRSSDHVRLRAALGDAAFEAAYVRGRTLSSADALALATAAARPGPDSAPAVIVPAGGQATAADSAGLLSDRERQIVALLAGGAADGQIAEQLRRQPAVRAGLEDPGQQPGHQRVTHRPP